MIDYLHELIGNAPQGFEFLEYIFTFVLCLIGVFLCYKLVEALLNLFR